MGNSILNIGVSGLQAAQAALLTTSHNISNAHTPGYNRQQAIQSTNIPQPTGTGFLGQGVHISTVQRVYSEFLYSQGLQAQTQSSQLDSHYTQIKQIDNLLADTTSGLTPALHNFFKAVHDVASNPSSVPSRQSLLSNAEALVARFQSMDQRLSEMREGINSQITSTIDEVNSLAKEIATLNINIQATEGSTNGQPVNDMLDQRDTLVRQLSELVNVTVVRQDNGHYNIFIGNGQALVVGSQSMALKAVPSLEDPGKITVALDTGNKTILLPEKQLQGGSLGGMLDFRQNALDKAQNTLGLIAVGLAQTFNDQHQLGQDLNGVLGEDFFEVPEPKILSIAGNSAASTITANISNVADLNTSDFQFKYDGSQYTLTRLSDNTSISSLAAPSVATPLTLGGISVTAATIQANESFVIQPVRNGAKDIAVAINDTSKIAAAAPIRSQAASTNTGSASISPGTVNPLPIDPDLSQSVMIKFHIPYDGMFDVTGAGASLPAMNQTYTEGADISFNGWTVKLNGTPAAGDEFTISPNTGGVADNRNALLLAGLQTKNTLQDGTASFQSTYAQLVSQIGNKTRELEVTSKAQANLLAQTDQSIQALSGVNLEEEAANLLRYQQAFQASGKVIEVSHSLFDTLLRI